MSGTPHRKKRNSHNERALRYKSKDVIGNRLHKVKLTDLERRVDEILKNGR